MAGDIDYLCSNSCLESFWLTKKVWLSIIMMMIYRFLYNNDGDLAKTWPKRIRFSLGKEMVVGSLCQVRKCSAAKSGDIRQRGCQEVL